jgi:hypothetical protein
MQSHRTSQRPMTEALFLAFKDAPMMVTVPLAEGTALRCDRFIPRGLLVDENDRKAALNNFRPEETDADFLPYLDRINRLTHAVSEQCCSGHMEYARFDCHDGATSTRWGYLQLLLDADLAESLSERILGCDWLLLELSQLWHERAGRAPGVTAAGSYQLTLAWHSSQWPKPIEEICQYLEQYHEQFAGDGA